MRQATRHSPSGRRLLAPLAALLACLPGAGCASPPGLLFEPAEGAVVWPPPPDEPRVRYAGQLRSAEDLEPGRGPLQRLGRAILGPEPPVGVLVSPIGVCTDGADRVFVADSGARAVHVFNLRTRKYQAWRPPEPGDALFQPVAVAWDPAGRLLVSDPGIAALYVFDTRGRSLGTLGDGQLSRPVGIAVDRRTRNIYIADTDAHRVVVLSPEDVALAVIGSRGSAPGLFNFPTFVAIDEQDRLYVSDSLNFRVQVFDAEGRPVGVIGSKGDLPGYFAQPKGVAVDPAGRIFVVDSNFEAVQIFNPQGEVLMSFGQEGHAPGEFWLPVGVEIDRGGRIWIADSYNRRVQAFEMIDAEEPTQ